MEQELQDTAGWTYYGIPRNILTRARADSTDTVIFDPRHPVHVPDTVPSTPDIPESAFDDIAFGETITRAHIRARRPLPPIPTGVEAVQAEEVVQEMAANNNAFPPLENNAMNAPNRSANANPATQVNGNGANYASSYIPPLPVGHQQDLAYLYQQIQELSGILESNREKVNDVTRNAEEVARRANLANGHGSEGSSASDQARIRELERELAKKDKIIELYKHEQKENTALIGDYEEGVWTMTDRVRQYANNQEGRLLALKRHYNDLLQQEKDEHLETRLDRDRWHANVLRCSEMIRNCYRARVDEWCDEYRVIVGLQSEVRCLRRCLGMEAEKPEEEAGWPYLKDAPFDDQ